MSSNTNVRLLERAADLIDELQSHPSGLQKQLERAVESNDLDSIHFWVSTLEARLSQEHFKNWDIHVW